MPLWLRFVQRVGVPSAIALGLTYVLATQLLGAVNRIEARLDQHMYETNYMQRQMCVSLAILAGQRTETCSFPDQQHDGVHR